MPTRCAAVRRRSADRFDRVLDLQGAGLLEHERALDAVALGKRAGQACEHQMILEPGLNSSAAPGLISSPPLSSRIFITPWSIDISWISTRGESAKVPPTSRSEVVPVLRIRT